MGALYKFCIIIIIIVEMFVLFKNILSYMSISYKDVLHHSSYGRMSSFRVFMLILFLLANATVPVYRIRSLFEEQCRRICRTRWSNLHYHTVLLQLRDTVKELIFRNSSERLRCALLNCTNGDDSTRQEPFQHFLTIYSLSLQDIATLLQPILDDETPQPSIEDIKRRCLLLRPFDSVVFLVLGHLSQNNLGRPQNNWGRKVPKKSEQVDVQDPFSSFMDRTGPS